MDFKFLPISKFSSISLGCTRSTRSVVLTYITITWSYKGGVTRRNVENSAPIFRSSKRNFPHWGWYVCIVLAIVNPWIAGEEDQNLSAEISAEFQNKKFNVHFGEINSSTWKRVPEKFIQYVLSYHDIVVIGMSQRVIFGFSFFGFSLWKFPLIF